MYFLTYLYKGQENYGILNKEKDRVIPLGGIFKGKTLNDFICTFNDSMLENIHGLMKSSNLNSIPLTEVKLLAPIPYPKRSLFCLGKNYLDHAKEVVGLPGADDNIPKFPIYFSKIGNPAIGHLDMIKNHREITEMIDYEVELAVILGKDGINIREEDAEEYIFGYTIVNDISARNLQRKHNQWFKGKSLETFCPMGPYIVHKSQIPFPVELNIKCSVNGEIRQDSNTKNMIFNIPHIISDLSKGMELKAGDIIITGTPSGVGLGFSPFKFLNSKDKVECHIEKIGTLTNFIE
ncbi:MAG: fumarylacetoacetate hydrolase family protein [Anaeromicrobium sp.]|jgi:2-keto-4-pentenoate hydratase/2-oxohepta-3-ene-1,7-dioic acid hydratase in catechol pathway|uniref:fumarylacetoacetate hydrolase family protein n=1 Tax=Anaeromicrobium sp. TaxID=1929132 RepID=UPI0025D1A5BB|nr:fumarylacetoacetate hydrolase family protein [Anaeromicrobium sp.]MCT4595289.1 fumarylacetoacetate hydrolase family protein [Anaeromicrobium sp.]